MEVSNEHSIYKILHGQVYLPHNVQKFPSAETVYTSSKLDVSAG